MEIGDGQCPVVAAGLSPGGRPQRKNLGDGGRQLCAEVSRRQRCLVFFRWRQMGAGDEKRFVESAAVVLGGGLPRSDVGARRLVEQSVEELGRRVALPRW